MSENYCFYLNPLSIYGWFPFVSKSTELLLWLNHPLVPCNVHIFSTFLLPYIENWQKTPGFTSFFEIMIFFIFRNIYKNQWIWILLKTSISIISENTYKNQCFFIIFIITLSLFSPSLVHFPWRVRVRSTVRSTRTQYGTIQPSTSFFNLAIHFLL